MHRSSYPSAFLAFRRRSRDGCIWSKHWLIAHVSDILSLLCIIANFPILSLSLSLPSSLPPSISLERCGTSMARSTLTFSRRTRRLTKATATQRSSRRWLTRHVWNTHPHPSLLLSPQSFFLLTLLPLLLPRIQFQYVTVTNLRVRTCSQQWQLMLPLCLDCTISSHHKSKVLQRGYWFNLPPYHTYYSSSYRALDCSPSCRQTPSPWRRVRSTTTRSGHTKSTLPNSLALTKSFQWTRALKVARLPASLHVSNAMPPPLQHAFFAHCNRRCCVTDPLGANLHFSDTFFFFLFLVPRVFYLIYISHICVVVTATAQPFHTLPRSLVHTHAPRRTPHAKRSVVLATPHLFNTSLCRRVFVSDS